MNSGKRESVVVFCLSTISNLYLPSLKFYRPDHVAVFMDSGDGPVSELEKVVYRSVRDGIPCDDISEYSVDTHDYESILSQIVDIKKSYEREYGDDLDIFINISSGSKEFAAAGMFASMIPKPAVAFKVDLDIAGMSMEQLRQIISAINDNTEVDLPKKVTSMENENPDDEMVGFLRIMSVMLESSRNPRHSDIIAMLKSRNLWSHDPRRKTNYGRTTLEQKEEMYLKRHYFTPALENGWLGRPTPYSVILTEKGRAYASVFDEADHDLEPDTMCCRCMMSEEPVLRSSNAYEFEADYDFEDKADSDGSGSEVSYRFRNHGKKYRFHVWMD